MSAESPRRAARKGSVGQIVLPQVVSDPSIIDSVAGFIHEVVPQAYVSGNPTDSREVITWARFEQTDINDQALFPDSGDEDGVPPLLLVLGYGSGVQVWSVAATGEAREVLSWSQGAVRALRVLPSPEPRLPLRQDLFKHKRPLVALVDNAGPGPQFCSVGFISLKDGDQVKSIKFKNQVWDVLSNRRSVVISLAERIAVFDALTLEDHIVVTTCYPNPDVNPVALGTRWLAYADRRMVTHWRSMGGCQSEGPQSVTATMMHAAKFLGKGLRDLSETVANSLTGSGQESGFTGIAEPCLKGIVTIIDIEGKIGRDSGGHDENQLEPNHVLAHFNAHCEPIVALEFDPSGMLLLTADKRGYRFHLFRINTHPCGPTFASIQHLYILYRGDTTARIQDVVFSNDARWVAVSSMRGTTHVFPITPYGGPVGVRTHTTPHVVNKLSRFHRSAGLTEDGRNSPVLHEGPPSTPPLSQRTPTFVQPTTVTALAQLRCQPPHLSEDTTIRVAACFAQPRANIPPVVPANKGTKQPVDSLFVMACNGNLIEYELEPKHISGVTKEKICDDTPIELGVEARGEWVLLRPPYYSALHPPLSPSNPLLIKKDTPITKQDRNADDDKWLSQVEIVTHAGPHRRLWMGPQFTFKTYNTSSGSLFDGSSNMADINQMPARSTPVNMPLRQPLIIESGSNSSLEISPKMVEMIYKSDLNSSPGSSKIREDLAEAMQERGETRLREDLADAMMEGPRSLNRTSGVRSRHAPIVERQVNPLGTVVTIATTLGRAPTLPDILAEPKELPKIQVIVTENKNKSVDRRRPLVTDMNVDDVDTISLSDNLIDVSFDSCVLKSKRVNDEVDLKVSKKSMSKVNSESNICESARQSEERDMGDKRGSNGKSKKKTSKAEKCKRSTPDRGLEVKKTSVDERTDSDLQTKLKNTSKKRNKIVKEENGKNINSIRKKSLEEHSNSLDGPEIIQDVCSNNVLKDDVNDLNNVDEKVSNVPVTEDLALVVDDNISNSRSELDDLGKDVMNCDNESVVDFKYKVEERSKISSSLDHMLISTENFKVSKTNVVEIWNGMDLSVGDNLTESDSKTITESVQENDEESRKDCDLELKCFESDLLVHDEEETIEMSNIEEKDSDKEVDKVKNEETTDKDSSDDCQVVVVKPEIKFNQKRGKSRRVSRKLRDTVESEVKHDEICKTDVSETVNIDALQLSKSCSSDSLATDNVIDLEKKKDDMKEGNGKKSTVTHKKELGKRDGENDEGFVQDSNEGLRRRFRRKILGDENSIDDSSVVTEESKDLPPVRKIAWNTVVSSSNKDSKTNLLKPESEVQVSVRSWSSIASGPVRASSQEKEVVKSNSVEDRDSVYESCNDSIGEELEATIYHNLASDINELNVEQNIFDSLKNVSEESVDKSNTDSGDKDDAIGSQFSVKKSKKQKKKRR